METIILVVLGMLILAIFMWVLLNSSGNTLISVNQEILYKCPKCGGSDYFMSTRNVMKGMGGIYGNRGGLKKFPVCKVCDEIMEGL